MNMLTCAEYTRKALHLVSGSSTFRLLYTCTVLYLSACVQRFSQATKDHRQKLARDRKITKYRGIVRASILFWRLIKIWRIHVTCKKPRNIQNIPRITIVSCFAKILLFCTNHPLMIDKRSSSSLFLLSSLLILVTICIDSLRIATSCVMYYFLHISPNGTILHIICLRSHII